MVLCTIGYRFSSCILKPLLKSIYLLIAQMGYAQVHKSYILKVFKRFQIFCKVLNKYEILEDNSVLGLTFV